MFRRAFDFFIFSSLYISLCGVLMVYQTGLLLRLGPHSIDLLGFVFFSTVCSYNFHWYLSASSVTHSVRIEWTQTHRGFHIILYLVGLMGSAFYFFRLRDHWLALFLGAFLTVLYSAPKLNLFRPLRKIAIGKTLFLAFVWMYVTCILPILIARKEWTMEYSLYGLGRFFLIYAICILFDYRDREDDRTNGIRSMITFLSDRGITLLFIFCLITYALSSIALYSYWHCASTVIALLIPGIILSAVYNYARTHFSDYLYYFILDGLMMLSGLIMLIITI